MEFSQKLQELRKRTQMTQEELAAKLFVSRTAVSKWESGGGYPNLSSLKALATLFSVTIDELLSSDELLVLAEENKNDRERHFRDLVFGFLDVGAGLLLFLPLFAQRTNATAEAVSLLALHTEWVYLKPIYVVCIVAMLLWGVLTLALQPCCRAFWVRIKGKVSLLLNTTVLLLCILGLQPYAAVLLFAFLVMKVLIAAIRR